MKTETLSRYARPAIPAGYRELKRGEVAKSHDKVWVAGVGPWSLLRAERITPGYAYAPQAGVGKVGCFVHIRRLPKASVSQAA